jgi:hypothetical protein
MADAVGPLSLTFRWATFRLVAERRREVDRATEEDEEADAWSIA